MHTIGSRSRLDRRGQALAEYAALVAIIGAGLVVILGLFGQASKKAWDSSTSKFTEEPALGYGGSAGGGSPSMGGGSSYAGGGGGGSSGGVSEDPTDAPPDPADSTGNSGSPDSLGAQHASR